MKQAHERTQLEAAAREEAAINRKALYLDLLPSSHKLQRPFSVPGWNLDRATDLKSAKHRMARNDYNVALLQFEQRDKQEIEALQEFIGQGQHTVWIAIIPPHQLTHPSFCRLIYEHFYDFFTLPVPDSPPYLKAEMGHAYGISNLRRLEEQHDAIIAECQMVGASPIMLKTFRQIRKIASVDAPVLITGESGTGKELVARAIHQRSSLSSGPFVAINCGALPDTLIQAELFGYEKGAFTGANKRKTGRIEAANGGTLFLDEIGDLPLDLQVNLLRFLQEKTIERLGGNESLIINVRIIAATHNDLEQAVQDGSFREDLFYRLNVLSLQVPRLAEREGDIELLARFFFQKFRNESNPKVKGFTQRALAALNSHNWPGNIREMINCIRRALVMSDNHLITPKDLGLENSVMTAEAEMLPTLEDVRYEAEKSAIKDSISHAHNNISQAARQLEVSRVTLYRLMEKHHIQSHQLHVSDESH
ncbi:MAG: sigma-54 dependent transcriptional regulator [Motiliproteus sp.]